MVSTESRYSVEYVKSECRKVVVADAQGRSVFMVQSAARSQIKIGATHRQEQTSGSSYSGTLALKNANGQ